jgi:[acyl-carrier-protein] S-malonyltransferase
VTPEFTFLTALRSTGWLFPGQGSQYVGMGQALADAYPAARRTFEEADDVLGFGLSALCFEGPEDLLTDTINAQPALLTASIAALRALAQEVGTPPGAILVDDLSGGTPNALAGHSLGEYTALVAAGSLTFADGLRLVRTRGRLMKEAGARTPGMMAAVLGLDETQVAALCREAAATTGGVAQVANDNCPGQVVISGDRAGMEAAMAALSAAGAKKVMPLAVSIAAHSPLMAQATAEFRAAIAATPIKPPAVPVYANTTAAPLTSVDGVRGELEAQLTGSVRWTESIQAMTAVGIERFVEVGPGEVLTGLVKRIARGATRGTVNSPENLAAFLAAQQEIAR